MEKFSEMASARKRELYIPREVAAELERLAVEAAERGYYFFENGEKVDWSRCVQNARASKVSIPPDAALPMHYFSLFPETRVQTANETTLDAERRLTEKGLKPAALNFANGIHLCGGFLSGVRAQEEVLCRSSALSQALAGDPSTALTENAPCRTQQPGRSVRQMYQSSGRTMALR